MNKKFRKITAAVAAFATLTSYMYAPLYNSGISTDISGLFCEKHVSADTAEVKTYDEPAVTSQPQTASVSQVTSQSVSTLEASVTTGPAETQITSQSEPATAPESEKSYKSGCYTYTVNDNKVTITNFDNSIGDVVIPDTIDKMPVVCIQTEAFKYSDIKSVVIPSSVTKIGALAFFLCPQLKKVTLNEGITELGYGAFQSTPITEINIPASLSKADSPFIDCNKLTSVKFAEKCTIIPDTIFCDNNGLTEINIPDSIEKIGGHAFSGCSKLEKVVLNDNLKEIGYQAFYDIPVSEISIPASLEKCDYPFSQCTNLSSVKFSEGCTSIPDTLFYYCNFTEITIPDSVTKIGANAFNSCSKLEKIVLNEGLKEIGYHAFSGTPVSEINIPSSLKKTDHSFTGCFKLSSVKFADECTCIPDSLFANCESMTEFTVPDSITKIGSYVFAGCTNLKKVTLNEGLTSIGYRAFSDCPITEINIPLSLTSTDYCFSGCTGLSSVKFAQGYSSIPDTMLSNCNAITEITLPDSITKIGSSAFSGCSSLNKVVLNEGLKEIGYHAFSDTPVSEINIPLSLTSTDYCFSGCTKLSSVKFAQGYSSIPDTMLSNCNTITEITLPDSITKIGSGAFSGCSSLNKVVLNEGLKEIGYHAFSDTPVSQISIPLSLTSADYSFSGCKNLSSVKFAEGCTSVPDTLLTNCNAITEITLPDSITKIGSGAFSGCSSLKKIVLNEGLKEIGYHAFSDTPLTGITIPSTLTDCNYAFSGCDHLTNVSFADGTASVCNYMFNGCKSLRCVTFPESLNKIGQYSFADCKKLDTISSPKDDISFVSTSFLNCTSLRDQRFAVIDYANSGFSVNTDICPVNGVVNYTLRYKLSDNISKKSDSYSVILNVPEGMSILPDSVVCDDSQFKISRTEPFTISLSKPQSVIKFSVRVQQYGNFNLSGSLSFRYNDESWKQTIGSINVNAPDITISAPNTINSSSVCVNGIAVNDSDVSIFADGKLITTVRSNKRTGKYQATINVPEKESGQSYKLHATCGDKKSDEISVTYADKKPTVEKVTLEYNSGKYKTDDITDVFTQGDSPALYFNPAYPVIFDIQASNSDDIEKMYVTSTKGEEVKYMEALWDAQKKAWVASGFFDSDSRNYVPGALNVSIIEKKEIKVDKKVQKADPPKLKNVSEKIKKNSSVEVKKQTENSVLADIKVSDGAKSKNVNMYSDSADSTFVGGKKVTAKEVAKDPEKYGFKKSNVKSTEDGKTYSYYISTPDSSDINAEISSMMGDVFHGVDDIYSGVAILEILEGDKSDSLDCKILNTFVTSASKEFIGDFTMGGAFSFAGDMADYAARMEGTDDPGLQSAATILFAMQAFNTFGTEAVLTLYGCPPIVSSVVSGFISIGLGYAADYIDECISGNKEFSFNGFITFLIDPSGYIYEAVEGNRVPGVKTTVYYLDPKTNVAVMWDAENYSQQNPLTSDENGSYSWDVPEGKWQVKCEKEGYETAVSEWLDVPPVQTEVNFSLISHAVPEIDKIDACGEYASVTFSKYMDISTVSSSSLMLKNAAETIPCTVTPKLHNDGDKYTDTFILKPEKGTLESYDKLMTECTASCLSYCGTAAKAESTECTLNTDIFDLSAGKSFTIMSVGSESEITFIAAPGKPAAGKTLEIEEKSGKLSFEKTLKFDDSGVAKLKITANKTGTATITVNVEGSSKACQAEVVITNSDVKEAEQPQPPENPVSQYIAGDVDKNGVLNSADILKLKEYILLDTPSEPDFNGDVNGNGTVNALDLVALIKLFMA